MYSVTVEPHGRKNMVKEILRHGDTAAPEQPPLPERPAVKYHHAIKDAIVEERHDRQVFRMERLGKFKTHRFVPALLSERMVPCWRSTDNQDHTPAAEAQKKLAEAAKTLRRDTFNKAGFPTNGKEPRSRKYKAHKIVAPKLSIFPTMSAALKRTGKVEVEQHEVEWNICNIPEHPGLEALGNGGAGPAWDELREQKAQEDHENRSMWLAHDVKPGGKMVSPVVEEIKEIRQKGKHRLKSLSAQYEKKREAFQNAPEYSAMESFHRYCAEKKAKAKAETLEAAKLFERKPEQNAGITGFGLTGMLNLGVSKNRVSQPPTTTDLGLTTSPSDVRQVSE